MEFRLKNMEISKLNVRNGQDLLAETSKNLPAAITHDQVVIINATNVTVTTLDRFE